MDFDQNIINILLINFLKIAEGDCVDSDNGATDANGDTCLHYYGFSEMCGLNDDDDFSANDMCCQCKMA